MRKALLCLTTLAATCLFVQCVGSQTSAEQVPEGRGEDDGGASSSDGPAGGDDASADAPCGPGLATCGAGPVCSTKLDEDKSHCGACDHACMGGDCLGGQCQPELLASGFPLPFQANIGHGFAIDDQNLYFVTDTRVYKVSKTPSQDAGGAAVMLHEGTLGDRPRYVTVHNTVVWWTSEGVAASSGKVWRMSRDGAPGSATTLVTGQNSPAGVSLDGTYVYWTAQGAAQTEGVIRRWQLIGGVTPTDVITNQLVPRHLLVGSGKLYWDLGVSNVNVLYVANKTPGSMPSTVLDMGDDHVSGLVTTSTKLLWVTYKGAVWRSSIDGTNAEKIHTGPSAGTSVAADDSGLYASFQGTFGVQFKDATVVQINAPVGQPVTTKTLATLPYVQGLAVDPDFIFVLGGDFPTTATGGKLWRIRR